jgi:hypothetical protein
MVFKSNQTKFFLIYEKKMFPNNQQYYNAYQPRVLQQGVCLLEWFYHKEFLFYVFIKSVILGK